MSTFLSGDLSGKLRGTERLGSGSPELSSVVACIAIVALMDQLSNNANFLAQTTDRASRFAKHILPLIQHLGAQNTEAFDSQINQSLHDPEASDSYSIWRVVGRGEPSEMHSSMARAAWLTYLATPDELAEYHRNNHLLQPLLDRTQDLVETARDRLTADGDVSDNGVVTSLVSNVYAKIDGY